MVNYLCRESREKMNGHGQVFLIILLYTVEPGG
jgi:hypothetical protein